MFCLPFFTIFLLRSWWGEPARRCIREWEAVTRHGPTADSGPSTQWGQTVRHLTAASGVPWMRQQDPWKVTNTAIALTYLSLQTN